MLRIVTHIERLLLVHDCVIVPKFGGFVLQAVPAMQHKEEHTFRPLRKEIGFNMTLQHNDGLLPESYMQMHEVSYRQAQLMLEEDVEDIKNILQQYGKLSLGVLTPLTTTFHIVAGCSLYPPHLLPASVVPDDSSPRASAYTIQAKARHYVAASY